MVTERWRILKGLAVYMLLFVFCLLVWAGAFLIVWEYGWVGLCAVVAGLLVLWQVVFVDWPEPDIEDDAESEWRAAA